MPPEEATSAQAASRAAETGSPPTGDWASHLTWRVEGLVAMIRDRTVRPVATAVRYLVFGLLALFVAALLAVLAAVAGVRILTNEIPPFHTRVWASYLVVAGIFWLGGLLLSRKRRSRT